MRGFYVEVYFFLCQFVPLALLLDAADNILSLSSFASPIMDLSGRELDVFCGRILLRDSIKSLATIKTTSTSATLPQSTRLLNVS